MNIIQTQTDILRFLEQFNSLHDGYLLSAQFENSGISRGNGLTLDPSKTVLRLRYLVTSIHDAIAEITFEGVRSGRSGNPNGMRSLTPRSPSWMADSSSGQTMNPLTRKSVPGVLMLSPGR